MSFRITSAGVTDVGRKRAHNEDAFKLHPEDELFIMCDGMGGHASGEVASLLAVTELGNFYKELCREPNFSWPYDLDDDLPFDGKALQAGILYANDRIFVESMKKSELEGMGTTICAMAGTETELFLAHVGDSRIYRYRDNRLEQLTEDHSLINHYRKTGELSEEELQALGHKKNVIVRALGLKDSVMVDVQVQAKEHGDLYLLCSDGLTDCVEDWVIEQTIANHYKDLDAGAVKLVEQANENGGKDNITVLLLRIEDPESTDFERRPTIQTAQDENKSTDTVPFDDVREEVTARVTPEEEDEPHTQVALEIPPIPLDTPEENPVASPAKSKTKRRLKIVVSSGEVDLFGDQPEEQEDREESPSLEESPAPSDTIQMQQVDPVDPSSFDPEFRDLLSSAVPGDIPSDS